MTELSIVPSFGMAGENDQTVIINYNSLTDYSSEKFEDLSLYLINSQGMKIDCTIREVDTNSAINDSKMGTKLLKIVATIHLPTNDSEALSSRKFDLILSNGNQVNVLVKEAFIIYDSIAVLVHGVLASARTWDKLIATNADKILYLKFDYEKENHIPALNLVKPFNDFIQMELTEKGYSGRFDIVCHSMGAQITRLWMMNYPENDNRHACKIRQWIGVAPVIYGSANADGFLTDIISVIFNRPAFSQLKTNSRTTKMLENNERFEIKNNVKYRIILGCNAKKKRIFYWWYEKKYIPTCILYLMSKIGLPEGLPVPLAFSGSSKAYDISSKIYYKTFFGDGVLANCSCLLPNASINAFEGLNHSSIVNDPNVSDLIRNYLSFNPDVVFNDNFEKRIENDIQSHI